MRMAYVKKLSVNGTSYDIKDANAAVNKYATARFAMIGDSNSVGYGWEMGKGVMAVLPEYFPEATFNAPLAAYTWNTSSDATYNMVHQATQIVGTPDVIFTWCGGNDISHYAAGDTEIGYPDFDEWTVSNFDDTTTYGGMNKCLSYLRTTYPHAKIVGVFRTWKDNQSLELQKSIYGMINALYKKYNCAVINLNDYSSICDKIAAQKNIYFSDSIHYNELAFRELITPVFVGVINAAMNSNTDINVETVYTDVASGSEFDWTTLPRYLGHYFKTSGALRFRSHDHSYQALLITQTAGYDRHDNLNAIRLKSNSEDIQSIRYDYNTNQVTIGNVDRTYELNRSGLNAMTIPEGSYKITSASLTNWSNLPVLSPQLLTVKVMNNGNRYYTSVTYDHTKVYTGTMTSGASGISWTRIFQSFYGPLNNPYDLLTAADGIYTITSNETSIWTNVPNTVAPCLLIIRTASTGFRYYLATRYDGTLITGIQAANASTITWKYYS